MGTDSTTNDAFPVAVRLFRTLRRSARPLTSRELSLMVNVDELHVLRWLASMMAPQYVQYDPETQRYRMERRQPRPRGEVGKSHPVAA